MFFWKLSLTNKTPSNTHFPHSFECLSGSSCALVKTGDCWPDSTPDDMGERSDSVESSAFSAFPVNRKSFNYSVVIFIGLILDWIHMILSLPTKHNWSCFPRGPAPNISHAREQRKRKQRLMSQCCRADFNFTSMEFIFKLRDDDINNSKIKKTIQ